jgi:hypothetical protein
MSGRAARVSGVVARQWISIRRSMRSGEISTNGHTAETSVVDQHRELGLALDRRSGGIDAIVLGQVGDEDAGRDAVLLTQMLGQRLESVGATGHQDDVAPRRGEALCVRLRR